jgi:D-3-phosphoglycerate dehydrogenase / 2-oxoglutarate reductase
MTIVAIVIRNKQEKDIVYQTKTRFLPPLIKHHFFGLFIIYSSSNMSNTSFPKNKMKIALLEGINPSAIKEFNAAGYRNVEMYPKALSEKELLSIISDVHVLGIRSKTNITEKVIERAQKLLTIGCFCIGTNQVDMKAATIGGVAVFNSPYSNTRSVAEIVIGNAIMLIRHIPEKSNAAHVGGWLKDHRGCYEMRGKTLGIIGYGHIGSQVSVLAEGMGMKVIYYDIAPKLPLGNAVPVKSLNELLKIADVITLHVPGGKGTENMMSAARIRQMKKSSYLINYARGTVVDIPALKEAIESGHLAGAAIDVFPEEPESKNDKFISPLQGLRNVILTPHIGGSTEEAQVNIGNDVAHKLISFMDTGASVGSHSVPELSLPVQHNTHRLLHIHHNMPGILSEINGILSKKNVNIAGQYLKTNDTIGYVVLDIEKRGSDKILNELKKVKHTIKTRILY